MKQLLIKQCFDQLMWYSDHVGKLVPYTGEDDNVYWSRENDGTPNIVQKHDAIVVTLPRIN